VSRSARLYLNDMLEACDRVVAYTSGMDPAALAADAKTMDAVIRNMQVLGEASKRVPDHVRALAPAIPWREIAGMRDVIVHDYFGVDTDIVREVAFVHVPSLRDQLVALLEKVPWP
jgi:uncharacterized protein with HEPN domain